MTAFIHKTPTDFEIAAELYFQACQSATPPTPLTLPGLAYALGFSRTDTLLTYRKGEGHTAYHDVANRACLRIEAYTATQLYNKAVNVAGPVFALKNQGWTDKAPGEGGTVIIKIDGVTAAIL